MRMTTEQLNELLRRPAIAKANPMVCSVPSIAEPEQVICHEPLEEASGKEKVPGRFLLSVVSYRMRLIDPDNLCAKYAIDCLRYAGAIPDDSEKFIEIKVSQKKCKRKTRERTEITIEQL